ncbi:hypothetical protein BKA61DRAFT_669925 [Leptodontidium sp. MPI-SDFR-AT-0119]|nr:hypothetical protein BKA61DRAFT_669925 [Leptodontidium sp. MPI-SDFR-AT-0119]
MLRVYFLQQLDGWTCSHTSVFGFVEDANLKYSWLGPIVYIPQLVMQPLIVSLLSYGFGHINSGVVHSYQINFLACGLLTVVFRVIVFIFMPDSPVDAKFLNKHVQSGGITPFGPQIISPFGFDKFKTILPNMPFGAMQMIATMGGV